MQKKGTDKYILYQIDADQQPFHLAQAVKRMAGRFQAEVCTARLDHCQNCVDADGCQRVKLTECFPTDFYIDVGENEFRITPGQASSERNWHKEASNMPVLCTMVSDPPCHARLTYFWDDGIETGLYLLQF